MAQSMEACALSLVETGSTAQPGAHSNKKIFKSLKNYKIIKKITKRLIMYALIDNECMLVNLAR